MATFQATITRPRGKKVVTENGRGWTTVPDGIETADITLEVDVQALMQMLGRRAMGAKTRKSVLAGGDIVARATNIRRIP